MKVASVVGARAIWLFNVGELNPSGQYIYDRLFPWLAARHAFAKVPANSRDQAENAWVFLEGVFTSKEHGPLQVTLKIFNDGIVAETLSSTDDGDAFLTDVLTAASKELGLEFTGSMVHRRQYVSELILICDKSLNSLHPQLRQFSRAVSDAFGVTSELTTIGFGGDPAAQPIFKFERAAGVPFSQNRYWSIAGLPTRTHVALLSQLEAMLGD
jgi:hypothetical protein